MKRGGSTAVTSPDTIRRVPSGDCTTECQLPGFETVNSTLFPGRLMKRFAKVPGVRTQTYIDDDSDNNLGLLISQQSAILAPPEI